MLVSDLNGPAVSSRFFARMFAESAIFGLGKFKDHLGFNAFLASCRHDTSAELRLSKSAISDGDT